ncbi:ATP-binding protein [Limnoraphis robusta]|uniref:ATP-binding protein n=1 Tax=Limnoraphis robusta CCNP1315 TaxID=3110306 RepID=A0ABU5TYX7_9CYAN|nr:ATP-binding protein [Limnoraphis robusta]MEA5520136.1 ATP-binding protein [Limnoraphis robusta CCNP1315]MEA5543894.1 ATP-binding protein [Limnoraphis robusta CCNP1324]
MLIEFSVENYRSIREKITFSLVASEDIETLPENTFAVPGTDEIRLLKSAVIYGPNAAGKSNLVRAMYTLKNIVRNSATGMRGSRDKLPVEPFRLDSEYSKKPTLFELIFIYEEVRYEFGVSLDQERVYEEWLIAYFDNEQQNLYERIFNPDNQELKPDYKQYNWYFGENLDLSEENRLIKNLVRRNSLFLSHAAQNSHPQLEKIYNWFGDNFNEDQFNIFSPSFTGGGYTAARSLEDNVFRKEIVNFLQKADLGISGFRVDEKFILPGEKGSIMMIPRSSISETDRDELLNKRNSHVQLDIITSHKMIDSDEEREFYMVEHESKGTQRFFELIGLWFTILEKGRVLVIDEMESSLHPILSRFLVKMFNDPLINKNNAQLIFTTHDTTFLCDDLFRQDQVWFVEKEKMSITRLYSLLEFQPQEDESLQTGYLLGRYGAIPFIGGLNF